MEISQALDAARANHQSVLTTIRGNGLPQLSNVVHTVDEAGVIRVSTSADRAKYVNLQRRPWAGIKVDGKTFWSYAVLEAEVTFSAVAHGPDDEAADELVALYRSISGEHDDWGAYRAAMVTERRVVLRLRPTRAYGMLR